MEEQHIHNHKKRNGVNLEQEYKDIIMLLRRSMDRGESLFLQTAQFKGVFKTSPWADSVKITFLF